MPSHQENLKSLGVFSYSDKYHYTYYHPFESIYSFHHLTKKATKETSTAIMSQKVYEDCNIIYVYLKNAPNDEYVILLEDSEADRFLEEYTSWREASQRIIS